MSFFQDGPVPDKAYVNIRDEEHFKADRSYVESLWDWFQPFADAEFLSDAKTHFVERLWEMYLAKAVAGAGWVLERAPDCGPDLLLRDGERRIWIEATAPGSGEGDDAVPELQCGVAQRAPEEEILLRLRSAISAKLTQWQKWREKRIVDNTDSFIVGINGRRIRAALGDPNPPYIVKAVLPFGPLVVVFDRSAAGVVDSYYDFRDKIEKKSGAQVATDVFLNKDYMEISAVVYSYVDMVNRPRVEGDDFVLVHNRTALAPVVNGFLGRGKEYWMEEESLKLKSW